MDSFPVVDRSGRTWLEKLASASLLEKLPQLGFYRSDQPSGEGHMHIKRMLTFVDEVRQEFGRNVDPPLRKVAAVAVLRNPFAGRFEPDLGTLTDASEAIGAEIAKA